MLPILYHVGDIYVLNIKKNRPECNTTFQWAVLFTALILSLAITQLYRRRDSLRLSLTRPQAWQGASLLYHKNSPEGVDCVQRWLFTSVVEFPTGTISTAGRFRYAVDCVLPLVTWWSVNIGLAQHPMPVTPSPIRWWRFTMYYLIIPQKRTAVPFISPNIGRWASSAAL